MVRFPPKKSHDTFCPPISRFPKVGKEGGCRDRCQEELEKGAQTVN